MMSAGPVHYRSALHQRDCADRLFLPELWRGAVATCRLIAHRKRRAWNLPRLYTRAATPPRMRQFSDTSRRCIACDLCRTICAETAISFSRNTAPDGTCRLPRLWIDSGRCISCGLCVEVCPVGALEPGHAVTRKR